MTEGIVAGIESGWFIGKIADAADEHQRSLEDGQRRVVGVNAHTSSVTEPLEILQIPERVEVDQCAALAQRRTRRDAGAVRSTLNALVDAARSSDNLVPPMLDAIRAEATVGEVCGVLRGVFGEYREPAMF
jgi:methylmalonyl-CoA mutase N-terminal domain/subunit